MTTIGQGWVQYEDEKSGKPYYYNSSSKETSWENPNPTTTKQADEEDDPLPMPRVNRSW